MFYLIEMFLVKRDCQTRITENYSSPSLVNLCPSLFSVKRAIKKLQVIRRSTKIFAIARW